MKRESRLDDEAQAALAALLQGRAPEPPLSQGLPDFLLRHRLGGLAVAADEAGLLRDSRLEGVYQRQALEVGEAVWTAKQVMSALESRGIGVLAFKGAGLHLAGLYPDPGVRPVGDIDLLVRPPTADEAVQVLVSMGFTPWHPWSPQRLGWSDALSFTGALGGRCSVDVDLHWRTEYDRLRFGEGDSPLWGGVSPQGHPAPAPHLLVIIEHMLKHLRRAPHLLGLVDCTRLVPEVDWSEFVALARGRPLGSAVGLFLEGLSETFGLAIPAEVPSALAPRGHWNRIRRRWISPEALLNCGSSNALKGLGTWTALAGSPGASMRAVRDAAFPDRRWLKARYGAGSPVKLGARYLRDCVGWAMGGSSPLEH